MGHYRPRPLETKTCKHCAISFESNHKRAIYCGESCRQLAYQARHRADQEKPRKAKGDLPVLAQNVVLPVVGTAVAAVANYLYNDRPTQQAIMAKLESIEKGTEQGLNQLMSAAQLMVDYVNVQVSNDLTLKLGLDQMRAKRVEQSQRKQQIVTKLLSKNAK